MADEGSRTRSPEAPDPPAGYINRKGSKLDILASRRDTVKKRRKRSNTIRKDMALSGLVEQVGGVAATSDPIDITETATSGMHQALPDYSVSSLEVGEDSNPQRESSLPAITPRGMIPQKEARPESPKDKGLPRLTPADHLPLPSGPGQRDDGHILSILKKPVEQRNDDDLKDLYYATQDVKFFERLSDQQHLELCRVMTYEYMEADHTVFSQGDDGSTFYIIYTGACKVYVSDTPKPFGPGNEGNCVCVLHEGDSFGELALLGNGLRNATVVTGCATQCLEIEIHDYENSLQKLHEADLRLRVNYLEHVFIFYNWSEENLKKLAYVMTSHRFEKNTTIIQEGDSTDSMYFLKEGTCRVLKKMELPLSQQAMLLTDQHRGVGDLGVLGMDRSAKSKRFLEICEMGPHQYFGELAFLDKINHTASVVSVTPVEVLVLSKYDFYHCVDSRTQELMHVYSKKFYFDEDRLVQDTP